MLGWIGENGGTLLVCLALAALLLRAVLVLRRDKKRGRASCGGSCGHCPLGGSCQKR